MRIAERESDVTAKRHSVFKLGQNRKHSYQVAILDCLAEGRLIQRELVHNSRPPIIDSLYRRDPRLSGSREAARPLDKFSNRCLALQLENRGRIHTSGDCGE